MNKAEQDVLSADVVVIEHACFFLGQHNNAAGSIGKALKHGRGLFLLVLSLA
jgi:hypothetical protein